jgi:hypothetical protein
VFCDATACEVFCFDYVITLKKSHCTALDSINPVKSHETLGLKNNYAIRCSILDFLFIHHQHHAPFPSPVSRTRKSSCSSNRRSRFSSSRPRSSAILSLLGRRIGGHNLVLDPVQGEERRSCIIGTLPFPLYALRVNAPLFGWWECWIVLMVGMETSVGSSGTWT